MNQGESGYNVFKNLHTSGHNQGRVLGADLLVALLRRVQQTNAVVWVLKDARDSALVVHEIRRRDSVIIVEHVLDRHGRIKHFVKRRHDAVAGELRRVASAVHEGCGGVGGVVDGVDPFEALVLRGPAYSTASQGKNPKKPNKPSVFTFTCADRMT